MLHGIFQGKYTVAVGKTDFSIEPGKLEIGIGYHGESGIEVTDLKMADEMAVQILDVILL